MNEIKPHNCMQAQQSAMAIGKTKMHGLGISYTIAKHRILFVFSMTLKMKKKYGVMMMILQLLLNLTHVRHCHL